MEEEELVVYSFKYPDYRNNRRFFAGFLLAAIAISIYSCAKSDNTLIELAAVYVFFVLIIIAIGLGGFHFAIQGLLLADGDIFRVAFASQYTCLYISQRNKTQKILLHNPSISFELAEDESIIHINEHVFTCTKKNAESVEAFLKMAKLKEQARYNATQNIAGR